MHSESEDQDYMLFTLHSLLPVSTTNGMTFNYSFLYSINTYWVPAMCQVSGCWDRGVNKAETWPQTALMGNRQPNQQRYQVISYCDEAIEEMNWGWIVRWLFFFFFFFFFFFAVHASCRNSWARDQTCTIASTRATAITMLDP